MQSTQIQKDCADTTTNRQTTFWSHQLFYGNIPHHTAPWSLIYTLLPRLTVPSDLILARLSNTIYIFTSILSDDFLIDKLKPKLSFDSTIWSFILDGREVQLIWIYTILDWLQIFYRVLTIRRTKVGISLLIITYWEEELVGEMI